MRAQRDLARQVFGRDINHVLLLHLGSFSAEILPDLFALLTKQGFEIVTLEEAQSDPVYATDPDTASPGGGTLTELDGRETRHHVAGQSRRKPRERVNSICQLTRPAWCPSLCSSDDPVRSHGTAAGRRVVDGPHQRHGFARLDALR